MGKRLKFAQRGAANTYISRTQALRKLQLSLSDFRRLCILKGIYPRVPSNFKHLKKTSTFYFRKDIKFLSHEPLLRKFREIKAFTSKIRRALGKGDKNTVERLRENKPVYTIDHLVKERYPTFLDALRDLDDALCLVFLFRIMPRSNKIKGNLVSLCDTLSREFMNYVIYTNSLRKTFLSIKGIYYQVEIMGQTITWITPYLFKQKIPEDVDFHVMLNFLEFYATALGFVNCHLFQSLGLKYPPE
ncbi:hypothetical protein Zmor_016465 [Zophobas morio]|uniref:Pescadillo-like protein n=1 Tax=Zophobas morio TaxID=2755281 RepID=A0AA38HJJ5_9CUCU|nr:hypothetical protein Zmor_016465 [Zophobas morio]